MEPIPLDHSGKTAEQLAAEFRMAPELERCLEDLESRIDPDAEDQLLADYRTFLECDWPEPLFVPQRQNDSAPRVTWPDAPVNEALNDFNRMALQQFGGCSSALANRSGSPLAIRANYGVCISSAWFGCELRMMDEKHNTLPTSIPLDDRDRIEQLLSEGLPDITAGYGARVFAMGHIFWKILQSYPRIGRYVHVYHPDLQSPIDTCELVWGSDVLLALYEIPERVHFFLGLLTETYIDAIRRWSAIHPFSTEINAHWGLMHKGNIMLRTDSGMNLSPSMYDEFIRPYEQRCLDACGGGAIHFCGRGDLFIASMTSQRGLTGINLSQPHLNDMEIIYRNTVDRGIPLLGFSRKASDAALAAGRDLRHLVMTTP